MSHNLDPELDAIWKLLWEIDQIYGLSDDDWDDLYEAMSRLHNALNIPLEEV